MSHHPILLDPRDTAEDRARMAVVVYALASFGLCLVGAILGIIAVAPLLR